ncbi:MAG: bifunctional phosphopantothenoylcysteine decarboxylase/phosphopantothenate--cysteine ligase CoaBC [Candidatus Taylorbacteria bacterium]
MTLHNKKILVGVTGGIAAYRACSLVSRLLGEGAEVRVVMTDSAKKFVTQLTFQALTNHPVYDDLWNIKDENSVEHISVSHWADLIVVAPVTANTIAKFAHGIADNLLTTIVLARLPNVKVVLAPAMNVNMWNNSMVQKNVALIKDTKEFIVIEPRSGVLACRDEGKGKIADVEDILDIVVKSI